MCISIVLSTVTMWADLDKLAIARSRSNGAPVLIARDDRTRADIERARPLSILVAISRIVRGRRAIDERYGGRGVVMYAFTAPPDFLIEAVTAAGGVVFDGASERTTRSPMATTAQLDAAFCDLATEVRRRVNARTFGDAVDVRESELRAHPIDRGDSAAYWGAIFELAALTGELVRENRAARWIESSKMRFPLALDLGGSVMTFPGQLAQTIVDGGDGTMRALVELHRSHAGTAPVGRSMPLLCHRNTVPLSRLSWTPLLSQEIDHDDVPVIVWVEDRGESIHWPTDRGPASNELRDRALANLAATSVEVTGTELPLNLGRIAIVSDDYFAAETILDPTAMRRVADFLGAGETLLVATPTRGQLVAVDGARAMLDDAYLNAFLLATERIYLQATERDRISAQVIVYQGKPLGRVESPLLDARRALRLCGIDPDA